MHDEQCTNGNIVFQPKLHLQQTFPLLCPKPYKHPKTTKLNLNTTKEKDNGTLLCHHLLLRQRKEGHGVVFFFFFSNIKKIKHTRKQLKKTKRREGVYLQAPVLPSHFWFLLLPFRFCTSVSCAFSWHLLPFK